MDQQWLQGLQCACVMGRAGRGVEEGSIIHGSAMPIMSCIFYALLYGKYMRALLV